jgi:hypothetical protein
MEDLGLASLIASINCHSTLSFYSNEISSTPIHVEFFFRLSMSYFQETTNLLSSEFAFYATEISTRDARHKGG